jgi:hypothetical protein
LAAVAELGGPRGCFTAAGIIVTAVTALAFYRAVAFLVEDPQHRTVLPLARRARARTSLAGDPAGQLEDVFSEAGVRRTL